MAEELVAHGSYSTDAIREEEKQTDMEGSSDLMELVEGRNKMRILPPLKGDGNNPFQVTHQHYIKINPGDPKKEKTLVYSCPRMYSVGEEPCGLCAESKRLYKSGNPEDRDIAKELMPQRKTYANVIDRKHPEKGVQKARFSKTVHEALKALREDEDDPCDFTHPIDGFDVYVEKTGAGKDTRYPSIKLASRPSPIAVDADNDPDIKQMNKWLKGQHDLAEQIRLPSNDDIEALLEGRDPQDDGKGGGGGGGSKRLSANSGRRRERSSARRSAGGSEEVVDGEFEEGGGGDSDDFPMDDE